MTSCHALSCSDNVYIYIYIFKFKKFLNLIDLFIPLACTIGISG